MQPTPSCEIPKRIFRTGSIADIPKFDIASQLIIAAEYANRGWSPIKDKPVPQIAVARKNEAEEKVQELLKILTKRMSASQLAKLTDSHRSTVSARGFAGSQG